MLLNIRNMMKFVFYLGTVWLRSFKHLFILDSLNVLTWMGAFFWLKYLKCTLIVWFRSLVFGMSWRHLYAFIVNVRRFNGYCNCVWKTIWMTIKVGFRWNNRCWDNKYTGHKNIPGRNEIVQNQTISEDVLLKVSFASFQLRAVHWISRQQIVK